MDEPNVPALVPARRKWIGYSEEVARSVCKRVAAGETLRSVCRGASMPDVSTVGKWARELPAFGERLAAARAEGGRPWTGRGSTYCEATAQAIFDRLCAGEAITAICRDPLMPTVATVMAWVRLHEDFREAYLLARDVQSEAFFEEGWALARAATPETAFLTKIRLDHLRWHASMLAPKRFGPLKTREAKGEEGNGDMVVVIQRYSDCDGLKPGEVREVARHKGKGRPRG